MGFPRRKRVIDGYARCLLCRADLSIACRGLSSLWDHWKGVEHTRLEQKYRIMKQRPLLDKSCRVVTAEEDRRIRRERMSESPVFLETELSLTVEERIAIEEEEEEEGQRQLLPEGSSHYLWLCNFVVAFTSSTSFGGWTKRLVENIVPVLACLKNRAEIKVISVEGEVLVGKAVAASLASDTPLVNGMVTAGTVFDKIRRQFLVEFSGLDPLSILEYFRLWLMPSVRERFLDRMPNLRRVSEKFFFVWKL